MMFKNHFIKTPLPRSGRIRDSKDSNSGGQKLRIYKVIDGFT
jgi:hypothetical protein